MEKAFKAQLEIARTAEEKANSNFVCPGCGGPAEMETFWSTSPNRPGMKILKRQIFCGKRPRRGYRNRPTTNCPVLVEEIGTEAITDTPRKPQLSVVRLETVAVLETTSTSLSEDLPEIEQSAPATPDLDQVIEWLALLPDEGIQEVLALARLEQKRRRLRNSLESRLESKSKAR